MTTRKIEISEDLYVALLNACACANDAVEDGFEDQADCEPYGYAPGEIRTRATRPYSRAYTDLGKAWDNAK